ncbi:MAG TPA: DNA polymerase III subunit beta [Frankiaceae bacterium]|nr:DNA polymerase III subunit beta [Frankiaceae bacterium]
MRFRVERDEFAEAVAWTARSLPNRPAVPVLSGLRLEVKGHELSLSGFDYEVSAQATLEVQAEEAGTVVVLGRLLSEITRSLPAAPVQLATDGSRAVLTCGTSRFTLPTMPVEDYPTLPEMPPAAGTIASELFAEAVGQVFVAAGRDDTLPMLTGIKVEVDGDSLTLAATDRYRLAVRELKWRPQGDAEATTALIPARTLAEAAKTLATTGAEVGVALGNDNGVGMAGFSGGTRRMTTRLIEADFPAYRSLIPAEFGAVAQVNNTALVEAVKRVSLVAQRNTPIRLTFAPDEPLVLDAGTGDDAQASESLDVSYDGEPLTIAYNPGYLLDGLGAIGSDSAVLSFNGAIKPSVITGKETEGEYRYLLMPIRLSG